MKKLLAFIMTIVMVFSIAVIPTSAGAEDTAPTTNEEIDYIETIENVFDFAIDLAKFVHSLVGGILGMLDKECPFCDEIHAVSLEDDDDEDCDCDCDEEEATTAPTTEEPTTEEPTTEEPTTEEPTTEEPTTEEPTTEEPTTEEPTTEEPTTEEPTTEEPTTEEPTTEAPTTEEPTTEEPTTEEPTTEEPTTEEPTTEEPTTEEPTTQPTVTYVTCGEKLTDRVIANDRYYNYTSDGKYPMNKDAAIMVTGENYPLNKLTVTKMATAYVKAGVVISEASTVKSIVFAGGNNFHGNGGNFKLVVNLSDSPVRISLAGTNKIGSIVLTKDNIGAYIEGLYVLV